MSNSDLKTRTKDYALSGSGFLQNCRREPKLKSMTASEKKFVERNLDLIFEFEKYVLEHPAIAEKIPRDAVVFMKVTGDQKFNRWSERQAKKQAKKGAPLISITVKKMGPVHSRIAGLALEHAA